MNLKKQDDLNFEKLNDLFVTALKFAENNDVDWQHAITLGAYHLMEFSSWQSEGDVPQISSLMLFAMKTSLLRRMNEDLLDEIATEFSITIEAGSKIRGNESQAVTILIAALQSCVEEMFKSRGAVTRGVH